MQGGILCSMKDGGGGQGGILCSMKDGGGGRGEYCGICYT